MTRVGLALWTGLAALSMGCGQGQLPGHYWDVQLATDNDGCNNPIAQYSDELTYRVVFDNTDAEVAIGPDVFAAGRRDGCQVTYESVTWTETRPTGDIQWTLQGEALAQEGDGSCGIANDWTGQEVFTVLTSDDPAIEPGCTYTLAVNGTYVGEVE